MTTISGTPTEAMKAVEARLKATQMTAIQKAAADQRIEAQRLQEARQQPLSKADQIRAQRAIDKKKLTVTTTNPSPVQKVMQEREAMAQNAKNRGNYMETEDFLRMKAFEIRGRIVLYQNLGMTAEYQQAQLEGAEVVKKYQALLAKAKSGGSGTTA